MKQLILILTVFNILSMTSRAYTQTVEQKVDSILQLVEQTSVDTSKIEHYIDIARLYSIKDQKKIKYIDLVLQESEKIQYDLGTIKAHSLLFFILLRTMPHDADHDTLLYHIDIMLDLAKKIDDKYYITQSYRYYGMYHQMNGQFYLSIEYYRKRLELMKIHYPNKEKDALYNIAYCYYEAQDFSKSLECLLKILQLNPDGTLFLGKVYCLMGDIYQTEFNQLDSAKIYIDQAIEFFQDAPYALHNALHVKAKYYDKTQQFDLAEKMYEKVINFFSNSGMNEADFAKHYLLRKNYKKAIEIAEPLVEPNKEIHYYFQSLALKILSESYAAIGQYNKAHQYSTRLIAFYDKFDETRDKDLVKEMEVKYQIKEKDLETERYRAEKEQQAIISRQRTILGIISLLAAILMGVIAFLQKRANDLKKHQNEILEQKVKERTQELTETSQELAEVKHIQLLEEAKTRFFANVSHEFRTPLTLIQGPLSTLMQDEPLSTKGKNMVKRALKNTQQLLHLISQMLDLTKFDANQLTLSESKVIFYPFIRRLIANFETYAQSKNIQLQLEYLPKEELQIKVDQDKFEKILNNYLSNAIKFTPKDGAITVKVQDLENRLQIAVADTGIGIAEDKLTTIFERFYQVQQDDNAPLGQASHYAGGTGIGLSLCKEYAELMNGNAWAESPNTSGKGSTFFFEFPKKEVIKPIDEKTKNAINTTPQVAEQYNYLLPANGDNGDASSSIDNNNTILLVEDNYDLRDFITTLLSDKYRIIAVEHGQAALDELNTMNDLPSLIISDVMMPVMDGFQLIEKLKSSEAFRHIPVMMLTARADMQDKLKALRIGVDDYMLKPFVNNELLVRVDNLILNFNSRKEMFFVHTEDVKPKVKITHTTEDTAWLQDLEKVVTEHITDFKLNADRIAEHMNVSRSKLFRKTKKITGLTVNDYIKELRLQTARGLIETGQAQSTKEVAYSVGYKHVDYFAQSYEKRFGKRPSEVLLT